ncbi:hypothetical protein PI126_g21644 [Phytophthora idaei]|nr:hypothetical protein PI126_g21644 [Phytophthora idaei]
MVNVVPGHTVPVVDGRPDILSFCDHEIISNLTYEMQSNGVRFLLGETVKKVETTDKRVKVFFNSGKVLSANALLYTVGRQAATDGLNLDGVGISRNHRGLINLDKNYQSDQPYVYAAGDCIGAPALASTSMEQGRLASCHMWNPDEELAAISQLENVNYPYGIYTIPEISMGDSPFRQNVPTILFNKILKEEPEFSDRFTPEAQDLIVMLLTKDLEKRLGCGPDSVEEIKQHPLFAEIDWEKLLRMEMEVTRPPHRMEDVTDESHLSRAIAKMHETREEIMPDSPVSLPSSPFEQKHSDHFSYQGLGDWKPEMADMEFDEETGDFKQGTIHEDEEFVEEEYIEESGDGDGVVLSPGSKNSMTSSKTSPLKTNGSDLPPALSSAASASPRSPQSVGSPSSPPPVPMSPGNPEGSAPCPVLSTLAIAIPTLLRCQHGRDDQYLGDERRHRLYGATARSTERQVTNSVGAEADELHSHEQSIQRPAHALVDTEHVIATVSPCALLATLYCT